MGTTMVSGSDSPLNQSIENADVSASPNMLIHRVGPWPQIALGKTVNTKVRYGKIANLLPNVAIIYTYNQLQKAPKSSLLQFLASMYGTNSAQGTRMRLRCWEHGCNVCFVHPSASQAPRGDSSIHQKS